MSNAYFRSNATAGPRQTIIVRMLPHSVYFESQLGGSAIMKCKPAVVRSIRIDIDACAIRQFRCEYPVEVE